jgi:hypothetical protein
MVVNLIDVPETLHSQHERGRIQTQGRRTDDRSYCTLLVIHEADTLMNLWTPHRAVFWGSSHCQRAPQGPITRWQPTMSADHSIATLAPGT